MRRVRDRRVAVVGGVLGLLTVTAYAGRSWSTAGLRDGRAGPMSATGTTASAATSSTTASTSTPSTPSTPSTTEPAIDVSAVAPTSTVLLPPTRRAGWVAAENARPGTDAWRITARDPFGWIEGYARATSVRPGETLGLHVDTASPGYTVEAYRMGFYGGRQGRLMWTSAPQTGVRQAPPVVDADTGFVEARWPVSTTVPVGADWPPGAYLLKLVSSAGGSSYVPVTVRDDAAHADLLVVQAVTTWQAYNPWGGCSLYACPTLAGPSRAVRVSYDRPYARTYHDGAADFLDHELALVAYAEELGLDVAYATNLDLHGSPALASRYRGVVSLGHDEYYSRPMRSALVDARAAGVNLAFFGANAVYRHVRVEPASDGTADRVVVNYRDDRDPVAATDPDDATVAWREQGLPEAALVGIQYVCAGVRADLVVAGADHWVWAGAGVVEGQALPELVGNEADAVVPGVSPGNLDRLAASPIRCGGARHVAATSYFSAPSGAGVFASGTIWWVCGLEAVYCSEASNVPAVRAATANVLRVFAAGPAGVTHPSSGSG